MSRLTHKMKTARQGRGVDVSANLKLFLPCNEGSGDILTDTVGNVVITSTTTATHGLPHAPAVLTSADNALTSGAFPAVALGDSCIVFEVVEASAVDSWNAVTFGTAGVARYQIGTTSVSIEDDSANEVIHSITFNPAASDAYIVALAYDGAAKTLGAYGAITTATVAALDSTTDASGIVDAITPAAFNTLNSTAVGGFYGIGMYVFSGGLPTAAEIIAELDWMYNQMILGHKVTSTVL